MADKYQIIGEMKTTDIKKGQKEILDGFDRTDKKATAFTGTLKKVGAAVVASFAVSAIVDFGRKVAETRGQFQKLQAVLENTLGSKSASQQAFRVLNQLAQQSNFGLLELTDSYVKLVNQGINPTRAEMVKLQDLANSTGKSFDQLTEAIIDAQVGEFERLKEFGIRAQKEGDKVQFTFKGVKQQVDFTNESIQKYLIGLGDLEGVTGSTEKISATLAGKISNLGDAFDNLLNNIGSGGGESILTDIVQGLIDGLNWLGRAIKEVQPTIQEWYDGFVQGVSEIVGWFQDLINESLVFRGAINLVIGSFKTLWDAAKLVSRNIKIAFSTLGDVIKGVFTLDWDLVKSGLAEGFADLTDSFRQFGEDAASNFVEAYKNTVSGKVTSVELYGGKTQDDVAEEFFPANAIIKNIESIKPPIREVAKLEQTASAKTADAVKKDNILKAQSTDFTSLSRANSLKKFTKSALNMALDRAIAYFIESAFAKFGIFGGFAAAGASSVVRGVFSSALQTFAQGGVIDGNSFSGDKTLVLANSGERVMNIPQQQYIHDVATMNAQKIDGLIGAVNDLVKGMQSGRAVELNPVMSSIALVDIYDDGTKNKRLLASG